MEMHEWLVRFRHQIEAPLMNRMVNIIIENYRVRPSREIAQMLDSAVTIPPPDTEDDYFVSTTTTPTTM